LKEGALIHVLEAAVAVYKGRAFAFLKDHLNIRIEEFPALAVSGAVSRRHLGGTALVIKSPLPLLKTLGIYVDSRFSQSQFFNSIIAGEIWSNPFY
jgi:hypothetical protein